VTQAPTRRQRLRTATTLEIKQAARRLLETGGPTAISLRAIARDLGMSAAALYRYFPSLDALVLAVGDDVYAELHDEVAAARRPEQTPAEQLLAMITTFRRWALGHPAEFALILGNPIPGIGSLEAGCVHADQAGARFGRLFMEPYRRLWRDPTARGVSGASPASAVRPEGFDRFFHLYPDELPEDAVLTFMGGWIRLYGVLAMEVFGHLKWALDDMTPLIRAELAAFFAQLGLDVPAAAEELIRLPDHDREGRPDDRED
jgi:AcrR family transcriptional regulator